MLTRASEITSVELQQLLTEFPRINDGYFETTAQTHDPSEIWDSVPPNYADITAAIPAGQPCFLWFTCVDPPTPTVPPKQCSILLHHAIPDAVPARAFGATRSEGRHDRQPTFAVPVHVAGAPPELFDESIFHGVMRVVAGRRQFFLTDVLYYAGRRIDVETWIDRYRCMAQLLHVLPPPPTASLSVLHDDPHALWLRLPVVGMGPPRHARFRDTMRQIDYPVKQCRYYLGGAVVCVLSADYVRASWEDGEDWFPADAEAAASSPDSAPTLAPATTPVPAATHVWLLTWSEIAPDTYRVESRDGVAEGDVLVRTFGESVCMNRVFRCIRENANLDSAEDSEDEAVYELPRDQRYLRPETRDQLPQLMPFTFHLQFRKWVPRPDVAEAAAAGRAAAPTAASHRDVKLHLQQIKHQRDLNG